VCWRKIKKANMVANIGNKEESRREEARKETGKAR
jgi:hypothetical protein